MKILVTGGAGFIGHNLVNTLLEQGHSVVVVDNLSSGDKERLPKEVEFIMGDIQEINTLNVPGDIDAIFHMAAHIDVRKSVQDPLMDAQHNVLGTIAVLEWAKRHGVKKLIFSSTGGAIYGEAEICPTPETNTILPEAPYGVAKLSAEHYIGLYSRLHEMETVCLRYANVYGPGQNGSRESGVIAIFCDRIHKDQPLQVNGDGTITRDFVYVGDVVNANIAALQPGLTGTYNIATGKETSLNQLIEKLKQVSGKAVEVEYADPKRGDIQRSCLLIDKAKEHLNWEPQHDLESGLSKTLEAAKLELS